MQYKFFIIILFFLSLHSVPPLNYNYSELSLHIKNYKKESEILTIYLMLMNSYQEKYNFKLAEKDFVEIVIKASELLDNNKKLSFLSMQYLSQKDQRIFEEMHDIVSRDLVRLHELTDKLRAFLSNVHVHVEARLEDFKFDCSFYHRIPEINQKVFSCIDVKDYSCVNASLDEAFKERHEYEKCINKSLLKT